MVKAKLGILLFSIVVFMLLMNVAHAAGSKLIFSDVDVKVGSRTSKNLDDGDTINDEAKPGDSVEFRVEVRNNFTDTENLDIEDITVDVTIEGIDDGDDLDDESSDFNLRPGRDKRVTIKFQVPTEVDEDGFDVLIHAEGDDENGTNHEVDMRIILDVNKESHLLEITRLILTPAEFSCTKKSVQLATSIINTGNEDEEDVTIQVFNSDLGVDLQDVISEITAEPNQDESKYTKTFSFNVPADAELGSYPITLRATYNDGRKKTEETATLTVNDCAATKPETTKKPEQKTATEEEEPVEVITPVTGKATTPVVEPIVPPGTVVTQESFLSNNALIAGIIIAEVIAVIVGIVLVVSLFRRKG